MSTEHEGEAEPGEWEAIGRRLLQRRVEFADQDVSDALRPLRQAARDGSEVPPNTAGELRQAIIQLETLAEIAETLDPAVVDPDDAGAGREESNQEHGSEETA